MASTPAPSRSRGDGRADLLAAAADYVTTHGQAALSVRAIARAAGVTHATVTHHFGSREGLLSALATQGYELLADALEAALEASNSVGKPERPGGAATAKAYVSFALNHPGHFDVMFDSHVMALDDPAFKAASRRAWQGLAGATDPAKAGPTVIARWSLVHGLAQLWRAGVLPEVVLKRRVDDAVAGVVKAAQRGLA